MRRPTLVLVLAVVLAAALAATALAAPQLAPGTINLSGTPTGSGTLEKDVAANFFLTKRVLGSQVHVTIDGHNAPVRHVGLTTAGETGVSGDDPRFAVGRVRPDRRRGAAALDDREFNQLGRAWLHALVGRACCCGAHH